MFENLIKNDLIDVIANSSEYEWSRVFFVQQDDTTITVLEFVSEREYIIPKQAVLEIRNYTAEKRDAEALLRKKLTPVEFEQLIKTHERHTSTMGPDAKYIYSLRNIVKVMPGDKGNLHVHYSDGNWWHYTPSFQWY